MSDKFRTITHSLLINWHNAWKMQKLCFIINLILLFLKRSVREKFLWDLNMCKNLLVLNCLQLNTNLHVYKHRKHFVLLYIYIFKVKYLELVLVFTLTHSFINTMYYRYNVFMREIYINAICSNCRLKIKRVINLTDLNH